MDTRSFDDLVRSARTAPRRRVLGGVLALALGGDAAARVDVAAASAPCKGDVCSGKPKRARCGPKDNSCACATRLDGSKICVTRGGICVDCTSDAQCELDGFQFCIRGGKHCCDPTALNAGCANACGA